jgi:hypothetical protein
MEEIHSYSLSQLRTAPPRSDSMSDRRSKTFKMESAPLPLPKDRNYDTASIATSCISSDFFDEPSNVFSLEESSKESNFSLENPSAPRKASGKPTHGPNNLRYGWLKQCFYIVILLFWMGLSFYYRSQVIAYEARLDEMKAVHAVPYNLCRWLCFDPK